MLSKAILIVFLLSLEATGQSSSQSDNGSGNTIIDHLEKISNSPVSITFENTLQVNNNGGHLQGIQHIPYNKNDYYVLSGSSDMYSYYAIVKSGKENLTISINKILDKPFKHAGGFQIYKNLMAIGVEDNDEKNKSKVFLFEFNNPERPPEEPLVIIERMGTFKRATAGCVGISIIDKKVLVVVGDWDTEHLDFYKIDHDKLNQPGATLELEYALDTKKMDKSGWIDDRWLSYQNINFLKDEGNHLFLAGMTSIEDEDIFDVYEIQSADLSTFSLKKIYTRNFGSHDAAKFRWGAGLQVDQDGSVKILTSGEHIAHKSLFHVYLSH